MAPARNRPCPCGSGKKYKRCCGSDDRQVVHLRNRLHFALTLLVTTIRKVNKMFVLIALFLFASWAATYFFARPYRERFSGSLTKTNAVQLNFYGFQREDISPICGCMLPQANWRGISFLARHAAIYRNTDAKKVVYWFVGPLPSTMSYRESLGFEADYYVVQIPSGVTFDASRLADKSASHYSVLQHKHLNPTGSTFLYTKPDAQVQLQLLGDKPIGAWIPAEGSTTTISYSKSEFASNIPRTEITEKYTPHDGKSYMELPVADFLGPMAIWTTDLSSEVLYDDGVIDVEEANTDNQMETVVALVIQPLFSIRMVLAEIEPTIKDGKPEQMIAGRKSAGKIQLELLDSPIDSREYKAIFESLRKNDITSIISQGTTWIMRYPPLPSTQGISVFGSLSSLRFEAATGTLMVGGRHVDVQAPSDIELRDIDIFEPSSNVLQVPLRYESDDKSIKAEFRAASVVSINGEQIASDRDFYLALAQFLGGLAGVLSLALSVWIFAKSFLGAKQVMQESINTGKSNVKATNTKARR